MAPPAAAPARAYDLHGISILVSSDEPAVLEAVDQRLRGFARVAGSAGPPDLRLEFAGGGREHEHGRLIDPPGPSRPVYDTPYGQLHYFADDDVLSGVLSGVRLHCAASEGLARVEAARFSGRELYLATHPLLTIALMELTERHGRFSIHAGCVARDDDGVLLAGPSGAGKSTLTLALAAAGLAFLSDDVVFLEHAADGFVRALGFADALGMTEGSADRFPDLRPLLQRPRPDGFPKHLVRVEDALPGILMAESCVPRALIFPEVAADEPSALTALDPREAWLRLVPDVLLTQPAGTQAHLAALAALLAQVRTYELRSGDDLDRAVELVAEALDA